MKTQKISAADAPDDCSVPLPTAAVQDVLATLEDMPGKRSGKEGSAIGWFHQCWSRGPSVAMTNLLVCIVRSHERIQDFMNSLLVVHAFLVMMLIAAVGQLNDIEVIECDLPEVVACDPPCAGHDTTLFEEDISTLPREESNSKTSLAAKLKQRLKGMVNIKKGLTIDGGAADNVMP